MPLTTVDKFGIIKRDKDYNDQVCIDTPAWLKTAVIYEVYIRSFSKEGTMEAFIQKIPELKELGINVIWLMPIHLIGHLRRKGPLGCPYSIRDHNRINPSYGTTDDFHRLVQEAHQNGMRVLIDIVANHAANDHVETKEHPDWFKQDAEGNFTRQIPGWSDVIDFNYEKKGLRKYMKEMVLYWAREFKLDGYRCDVAGMVPEDFWADVRKELLKINPEFIFLAEWEDPEMHIKSFNATYDWLSYYKLDEIFNGLAPAQDAIKLAIERKHHFPQNSLRLRFIENHDQARASYKFGYSSFKAFAAFIFTIEGIPLIFNGQEVGETKYLSLFDKNAINWKVKGGTEIWNFYKEFIELRKSTPVFTEGDIFEIENSNPKQIVSFGRNLDNKLAIVLLNLSPQECLFSLKTTFEQTSWKVIDIRSLERKQQKVQDWNFNLNSYSGKILLSD
jgi:cyclomaltodextrinase / maltogenic alpha-amylase / neopullulanase